METSYSTTLECNFCSGTVSTLLDITIRSIIQKSWRDTIIQRRQRAKLDRYFKGMYAYFTIDSKFRNVKISWNETETNRQFVNSPTSTSLSEKIQKRMEQYADKLSDEFYVWKYHCDNVIRYGFTVGKKYYDVDIFNYLDDFIYDSYGSIDFDEMAKKMLTCDKLDKELKFAIACEFCFEDEINELWPLVATESLLRGLRMNRLRFSLLWYWIAVLTNRLKEIPLHNGTIPRTMFIRFSHTKSAMEFFWKHITEFDNQVDCIGECVNKNPIGTIVLLQYWLPRMSDEFLKSLISLHGTHMMANILITILCHEFVLPFWQRTCNMYNSDQFATFFVKFSDTEDTRIKYLCKQIWNTASIEFKNHASNRIAAKIETKRMTDDERENFKNS